MDWIIKAHSMMQTTQLLLMNTLMMTLITHSSTQSQDPRTIDLQVQTKVNDIRELAIIKAEILRRLGVTEPPLPSTHAPRPEKRAIDNTDFLMTYRLLDLVSLHSEPSDEFADDKIIQFQLGGLTRDKAVVIESVNLLLRLKFKNPFINTTHEFKSDTDLPSLNQTFVELIDGSSVSKKVTKKEKRHWKASQRVQKYKTNEFPITIIVSNVTNSGKPDVILTKVKSTLKKSKSMKLSLPLDLIKQSFDGNEQTLNLYLQCVGCGKRAILILTHKPRLRHRRKRKQRSKPRSLHKRRPILFIQSRIISLS
ncbi:uncharacterized protein LOC127856256 [Dreissena polymorpha]|uniref:Uncharacterized protein n=1 Tax=Dreissena polymorpha TaxID=45954 RepID=A0A9D4C335_DREPO|nr:uncharacterized protein LOC127856256 [Dreissena polymorpha]KAH3716305.1 hypothetical protein DPMN_059025 [Dreissena polymorpha]